MNNNDEYMFNKSGKRAWSIWRFVRLSLFIGITTATCFTATAQTDSLNAFGHYAPSLPAHSAGQSVTLLSNGSWLLIGGQAKEGVSNTLIVESSTSTGTLSAAVLPTTLSYPRSGHTATMLPNGDVLVLGGTGADGAIVTQAELFDPQSGAINTLPVTGLLSRTKAVATVLSDGTLLVSGGISPNGTPIEQAELFNPQTMLVEPYVAALNTPRINPNAALLSTGQSLVWGGVDINGKLIETGELYNPQAMNFSSVNWWDQALPSTLLASPQIAAIFPDAGSSGVSIDSTISLRFNKPMQVQTINGQTVTVIGPNGPVVGKVVAVESGLLAFFTPSSRLTAGANYTILLKGVTDQFGRALPFSSSSFITKNALSTPSNSASSGLVKIQITKPTVKSAVIPKLNLVTKSALKITAPLLTKIATKTQKVKASKTAAVPVAARAATCSDPDGDGDNDLSGDGGEFNPPPSCSPPPPPPPPPTPVATIGPTYKPATAPVLNGKCVCDPVDLFSGLFIESVTDFTIPDFTPIMVSHVYRQNDAASHAFGVGGSLPYAMYLYSSTSADNNDLTPVPSEIDVVTAEGMSIPFTGRTGNTLFGSTWTNYGAPSIYLGASLVARSSGFILTMLNGTVMTFSPFFPNQLTSITDINGNTVTITLSTGTGGNISQVTSPNGRYVQFSYDSSNRIIKATDNSGRYFSYGYDPTTGSLNKVTDFDGNFTQYSYDSNGRLWKITDKRNNLVLTNTYDANGRVYTQTEADRGVTTFNYMVDGSGNVTSTSVKNARNHTTVYAFNASGYVTSETDASDDSSASQTYTYKLDGINEIILDTDALGRATSYTYDRNGNITSVTRMSGTPEAITDKFSYDSVYFKLTSHTDGLNHVTQYEYDSQGNLVGITDANGNTVGIKTNGQGLPTAITDPLGHSISIGYVQADISTISDPLNRQSRVSTDSVGRVISLVDPLKNQTLYSYDPMNRLQQVTDPLKGFTKMTYDANGNLKTVIDPRNNSPHQYSYSSRNQLQSYTDPLNASESYTYDLMGNLQTHTDRNGQVTRYDYDSLDRIKTITYQGGSTVGFVWDAGNRLKQVNDSVNGNISRTYDDFNRLTSETTPQGQVTYDLYDNADRLLQKTTVGTASIVYAYDNANRLKLITQGSSVVQLGYDNADRISTVKLPNGILGTYSFDDANNVLNLAYTNGATALGSVSYAYDAAGRRTSRISSLDSSGPPALMSNTAYNDANQMTLLGSQALIYDANGNLKNDGVNVYGWNDRNQLISISGSSTASFAYDALGRRRNRTVNGVSTNFLYDGLNIVKELNGAATVASYLTGPSLDEVYARTDSSSVQISYLTDALGSIIGVANNSGAITTSYGYDTYGNGGVSGAANANTLQYTGRENDGTGLYFNRARYYNPKTGRFISSDPIGLNGGLNTYAYANGDPVRLVDTVGLSGFNPFFLPLNLLSKDPIPESDALRMSSSFNVMENTSIASSAIASAIGAPLMAATPVAAEALCEVVPNAKQAYRMGKLVKAIYKGTMDFYRHSTAPEDSIEVEATYIQRVAEQAAKDSVKPGASPAIPTTLGK